MPADQDARAFAPRRAWRALVSEAIAEKVDAVALTGDVVDQDNRFYEAFSQLQDGVRKLVDSGIAVVAVAGNHDFDVLGRLTGHIDGFHLLGRGGKWQTITVDGAGGTAVRFLGWSFPGRYVTDNPLADCRLTGSGEPTVGLLHCDCNAAASSYGPVALADLRARELDVWVLGHIHRGGTVGDKSPLVLYTGSAQGLDPGEPGPHGAWLVTIEAGQRPSLRHKPLAALQWECVDIPLDRVSSVAAMEQAVTGSIRGLHETVRSQETAMVRAVGCRLRFTGRTPLHGRIASAVVRLIEDCRPSFDDISYFIESVQDQTRPDIDLDELARSSDPAGLLARRLLVLDRRQPHDEYEDMLGLASECVAERLSAAVFAPLAAGDSLADERVRDVLLRAGFNALDQLLAQKEAGE